MTDDLLQAYARISAHEFLVEILYAKWLSSVPEETATTIVSEIRRLSKAACIAPDAISAGDSALQVAHDCALFTNRILDKAVSRSDAMVSQRDL